MNYGLTQLSKGNAFGLQPVSAGCDADAKLLYVGHQSRSGALNRQAEAQQHFQRAAALAPGGSQPYFFCGRWLQSQGRIPEAIAMLTRSAALNSAKPTTSKEASL